MSVLLAVKATIAKEKEELFNRWYETDHCPKVLQFAGVLNARRYKVLLGEGSYQYIAMYEFEDEQAFRRYMNSEHLEGLKSEYDAAFGDVSERETAAYLEIWRLDGTTAAPADEHAAEPGML